jgi:hypothetical protein
MLCAVFAQFRARLLSSTRNVFFGGIALNAQADNVAKAERALELAQIRYNERGRHTDRRAQRPDRAQRGARIFCRCSTQLLRRRASLLRATGVDLQWSSRRRYALPFDELRRRSRINEAAVAAADAPDFSKHIRASLPFPRPF